MGRIGKQKKSNIMTLGKIGGCEAAPIYSFISVQRKSDCGRILNI
jgi:hypothetical protein